MPCAPEAFTRLPHGGRVRAAATRYQIALDQWLDLSTGINPQAWPVPAIPAACWARLPEDEDDLQQAAQQYYATEQLLPVAGSQAAIQALPQLRAYARVAVLDPGYAEHAMAWQRAGHRVEAVTTQQLEAVIAQVDVLVLIHPNNPTAARFARDQLLDWHAQLHARGGWLVVDEAFIDATPEFSLCADSARPGLIVLRSLGKFFGLAGARVGFVCAEASLLARLQLLLGPWTIATPARWLASRALRDTTWQRNTRQTLNTASARLHALLSQHGLQPTAGCALFQWVCTTQAARLHQALAQQAILTRLFETPASLRFGLPGTAADWAHLQHALSDITAATTDDRLACPTQR